jgi:methyl-accepting chemotaxis protein
MTAERGRVHRQTTQDNDRLQSNIEELLIVAAEASEGKLGVRARVTEGQLGNIASALNIMLENVANFIEQIRVASGRVASASVEIATSSGDLTQGVSEQTQQIDQTNEQLQALSDQTERVGDVTESAAAAAEETRVAAARGANAVREMGESMAQIREKVQVNAQKIKRLGERSMEISGIVKSISDISAQTDMLAFNASVESERGAEGRGFSMVADRVRDLAERTKQATAEIERLVSGIQNETAEAVLQMEKMTEEVERGTSKVQAANHSLEDIVGASNKSSDLVAEIRDIAGTQREEARRVLDAMVTLAEIAERAEQKVQQNRQTSEQLADLSSDLNAQISEFDTENEDTEEPGAPARLLTS